MLGARLGWPRGYTPILAGPTTALAEGIAAASRTNTRIPSPEATRLTPAGVELFADISATLHRFCVIKLGRGALQSLR